jgi:hypothetical protein
MNDLLCVYGGSTASYGTDIYQPISNKQQDVRTHDRSRNIVRLSWAHRTVSSDVAIEIFSKWLHTDVTCGRAGDAVPMKCRDAGDSRRRYMSRSLATSSALPTFRMSSLRRLLSNALTTLRFASQCQQVGCTEKTGGYVQVWTVTTVPRSNTRRSTPSTFTTFLSVNVNNIWVRRRDGGEIQATA